METGNITDLNNIALLFSEDVNFYTRLYGVSALDR